MFFGKEHDDGGDHENGSKPKTTSKSYSNKPIHHSQTPVLLRGATFDDLCDENAIVTRDVLVALTPCYAESQT